MFDPRLNVAVQPAIRQRIGFLNTTSSPSLISGMKPVPPLAVLGRGCGSGLLMVLRATAETRNDSASTATAFAPPIHWMRKPAIAGPETCATDRLISSLVLPSSRLGRSTRTGREDWQDTSEKKVANPGRRAPRY